MDRIYIRRQGNACTVFIDEITQAPLPISNFDTAPPGFPVAMSFQECEKKFSSYERIYVEKPKPAPNMIQRNPKVAAKAAAASAKFEKQVAAELAKTGRSLPTEKAPSPSPSPQAEDKLISHFQLLLAKWNACSEAEAKEKYKLQAEAVAEAILIVWPEMLAHLQDLKTSVETPKFTL